MTPAEIQRVAIAVMTADLNGDDETARAIVAGWPVEDRLAAAAKACALFSGWFDFIRPEAKSLFLSDLQQLAKREALDDGAQGGPAE